MHIHLRFLDGIITEKGIFNSSFIYSIIKKHTDAISQDQIIVCCECECVCEFSQYPNRKSLGIRHRFRHDEMLNIIIIPFLDIRYASCSDVLQYYKKNNIVLHGFVWVNVIGKYYYEFMKWNDETERIEICSTPFSKLNIFENGDDRFSRIAKERILNLIDKEK